MNEAKDHPAGRGLTRQAQVTALKRWGRSSFCRCQAWARHSLVILVRPPSSRDAFVEYIFHGFAIAVSRGGICANESGALSRSLNPNPAWFHDRAWRMGQVVTLLVWAHFPGQQASEAPRVDPLR